MDMHRALPRLSELGRQLFWSLTPDRRMKWLREQEAKDMELTFDFVTMQGEKLGEYKGPPIDRVIHGAAQAIASRRLCRVYWPDRETKGAWCYAEPGGR